VIFFPPVLRIVAALAVCLAMTDCAPPQERYLRIDATPVDPPVAARPALDGNIQLLPFRARGLLGDRHVVYLDPTAPGEARPSATLIWEDGPPTAVARIAARILQATRIAPAVLPPDALGLAAFTLDGSLGRFELVPGPGGAENAVVQIEFTLLAGPARSPAMIARYCRAEPTRGDPAAAFSRAISAISAQFAADLLSRAAAVNAAAEDKAGAEKATAAILIGQRITPDSGLCGGA
jgi:ABC-type uncharacterized transport system auxiliary subunit